MATWKNEESKSQQRPRKCQQNCGQTLTRIPRILKPYPPRFMPPPNPHIIHPLILQYKLDEQYNSSFIFEWNAIHLLLTMCVFPFYFINQIEIFFFSIMQVSMCCLIKFIIWIYDLHSNSFILHELQFSIFAIYIPRFVHIK